MEAIQHLHAASHYAWDEFVIKCFRCFELVNEIINQIVSILEGSSSSSSSSCWRGRKRKLFRVRGDLPDYIAKEFDEADKLPTGKLHRTKFLCKQLFKKDKGEWVVDLNKPYFQHRKTVSNKKELEEGSHYEPACLLKERFTNSGEEPL